MPCQQNARLKCVKNALLIGIEKETLGKEERSLERQLPAEETCCLVEHREGRTEGGQSG